MNALLTESEAAVRRSLLVRALLFFLLGAAAYSLGYNHGYDSALQDAILTIEKTAFAIKRGAL